MSDDVNSVSVSKPSFHAWNRQVKFVKRRQLHQTVQNFIHSNFFHIIEFSRQKSMNILLKDPAGIFHGKIRPVQSRLKTTVR